MSLTPPGTGEADALVATIAHLVVQAALTRAHCFFTSPARPISPPGSTRLRPGRTRGDSLSEEIGIPERESNGRLRSASECLGTVPIVMVAARRDLLVTDARRDRAERETQSRRE